MIGNHSTIVVTQEEEEAFMSFSECAFRARERESEKQFPRCALMDFVTDVLYSRWIIQCSIMQLRRRDEGLFHEKNGNYSSSSIEWKF
jgi:hypothetical protein